MEILLTVLLPETFRNSLEAHGELQVYVYASFFFNKFIIRPIIFFLG